MAVRTVPPSFAGQYGDSFTRALNGGIRAHYQPIVRLSDRSTIGYESLARGPIGSSLEAPDDLFAAARERRQEADLDRECRRVALEGAIAAGLGFGQTLFVNVEQSTLGAAESARSADLLDRALKRFSVVIELTERALTERPMELMRAVDRLRGLGARIALDDVGADPRSLALMPFVSPEVIKLDLRLLQSRPSRETAEVVHAVSAEAERTGALIVAEGIETEQHFDRALALGATLGQGWLFGRPAGLATAPAGEPIEAWASPSQRPEGDESLTPFEIVSAAVPARRGDKRLLLELSRSIETHTGTQGSATVILSTFQEAAYFTPQSAFRYAALAEHAALVGALGVGLSNEPARGVRGVSLGVAESLRGEWDVTVLGPHFAAAFVARDLGDTGCRDLDRRFEFALTYERSLVIRAATAMMRRLTSADSQPAPPLV